MGLINHKLRHNFLLDRKIKEIRRLHELDNQKLYDYENRKFIELVNYAYKNSTFYKKYYDDFGIDINSIKTLDDIGKLPIIDKNIVAEFKKSILTKSSLWMVKGYTSGTSGSSLTVYRTFNAVLAENAYFWNFRNMHGIFEGDKLVVIRGDLNNDVLYKFDRYSNILYLSSFNINKNNIYKYIKLLIDFNPKCILGYPSSLEMLSNELSKVNINLNIPVAITSSETLFGFQREKIRNFLGAKTFDWYGNAERTVAIEQFPDGNYYFAPGYGFGEVFNDFLLTTSFINNSFPLIRYKVNDVIELGYDTELTGRPSSKMVAKIMGRDDDYIFLPDGTKIGRVSKVFKGLDDVLFAQIIQDEIESVQLNVVPVSDKFDSRELMRRFRLVVGNQILIKFSFVTENEIIKTKAGKYKLVINSLFKKQ